MAALNLICIMNIIGRLLTKSMTIYPLLTTEGSSVVAVVVGTQSSWLEWPFKAASFPGRNSFSSAFLRFSSARTATSRSRFDKGFFLVRDAVITR